MNKTCVIFEGGMRGMGLTFHLHHLVSEIHRLNADIVLLHDGTEQEKGLLSIVRNEGVEDFDYSKGNIEKLFSEKSRQGYTTFVYHAESYGGCRLVEPVKPLYNIHVIFGMNAYRHGSWYRKYVVKYIKNRYSSIVDTWVFFSNRARMEFCGEANVLDHTFVIPWGVEDVSNLPPATSYVDIYDKKETQYQKDKKYIFYAAQFHKHKNHRLLIDILEDKLHDGTTKLMLGGNGAEMDNICELCKTKGIRDNVVFMGRVPRKEFITHMKNGTLSLVLSKNETFGHCIIEPLQLGIPTISTPTGIAPEAIHDFENGFTIPLTNMKKWKKIVEMVLDGKIKLTATPSNLYTWHRVAQLYVSLYQYVASLKR